MPLVLHGGSGVQQEYLLAAVQQGIAKINVGTEIRQAFERELDASGDVSRAQEAVAVSIRQHVTEVYQVQESVDRLSA